MMDTTKAQNSGTNDNEKSQKLKNYQRFHQMWVDSCINLFQELPVSEAFMEIIEGDKALPLFTLGNFSLIKGPTKSGKTFWATSVIAAAVKNSTINNIHSRLPANKRMCLYFDTEQSTHHAQKVGRRVLETAGVCNSQYFKIYSLRRYAPGERLAIIDLAIRETPNLGLVVIDGVRDLVVSVNDEIAANALGNYLLKWTEEFHIHINCIIHENKKDTNARGHLGTEVVNKAENIIGISRAGKSDQSLFTVANGECRELGFTSFKFTRDDKQLYIIDPGLAQTTSENAKFTISKYSEDEHREFLAQAFGGKEALRYGELQASLTSAFLEEGITITQASFRNLRDYYLDQGVLTMKGKPGTKSSVYSLVPNN